MPPRYNNPETGEGGDGYYHPSELEYHSSWDWLMPVIKNIRNFKDPNKTEDAYVFGDISVHISDAYPMGWNCHILGTLTRFKKTPTGMHDYEKLPSYSKAISSDKNEEFISVVWQSIVQFIQWYNSQSKTDNNDK